MEKGVATITGQQGEGTIISLQDLTQVPLQTIMIKYSQRVKHHLKKIKAIVFPQSVLI